MDKDTINAGETLSDSTVINASLITFIQKSFNQLIQDKQEAEQVTNQFISYSLSTVAKIVLQSTNRASNKRISNSLNKILLTLKNNPQIISLLITNQLNISDVIRQHDNHKEKNKRVFEDITNIHKKVKINYQQVTTDVTQLSSYANAAEQMVSNNYCSSFTNKVIANIFFLFCTL